MQREFANAPNSILPHLEGKSNLNQDRACSDYKNYAPDIRFPDHTPIRYVKLNFHIFGDRSGNHNFNKEEGKKFVEYLLNESNKKLSENAKMRLPVGNNTPVLPVSYRYVLAGNPDVPGDKGIYFHRDDILYSCNKKDKRSKDGNGMFSKAQYEKYGVQKEKIVNVLLLEHPLDSIESKTYKPSSDGVGTSHWVKVIGAYEHCKGRFKDRKNPVWSTADYYTGIFNHELGHTFGLAHTWSSNDGCDDTPKNPNCWNVGKDGKCPPEEVSNNVMDYNAWRKAFTPCQISKVLYKFSRPKTNQAKKLQKVWCKYNREESVAVPPGQKVLWNTAKNLNGDLVLQDDSELTIKCDLSLPKGARIIVQPGANLILDGARIYNDCGDKWQGIELWTKGKSKGTLSYHRFPVLENVMNPIGERPSN